MEAPGAALALAPWCPLCLQPLSEPAALPCGHVSCLSCLRAPDRHGCPECRAQDRGSPAPPRSPKLSGVVETDEAGTVPSAGGRSDAGEPNSDRHQGATAAAGPSLRTGSTSLPDAAGPKFRLASQITELSVRLEAADGALRTERRREAAAAAANGRLTEEARGLAERLAELTRGYALRLQRLLGEELGPGEAAGAARVARASEVAERLRRALLRAEALLTEDDEAAFGDELRTLGPHIGELLAAPAGDEGEDGEDGEDGDHVEPELDRARAGPKLEEMNADFRERSGEIQRSLRNALNPSEVTFDLDTAHPNLLLSGDLKTVTFSAAKQPYPPSPRRFANFLQVLSAQSFHQGEHRWAVELDGAPWVFGACHAAALARSGLPSALESSRGSWCLMWFENLLTAFERGHAVPLKRTSVACRLEVRLSFRTHRLSFYNVSALSGTTHLYTFKARLSAPVHLAYRMMAGDPRGRVTVH
ncbi:E3 ubiquitin-protein ligase TRIM58 [Liparis tanakae]|uniref:E3 ubiquitin-protein ligase TRIM58 n=1 Tax=Liparis tanakae TaxID=230148 RepID=A0A4Z2GGW0_9TELE|nr:E3 ubiquitin-protein ligase TRIM58 [Liparis tanakae]